MLTSQETTQLIAKLNEVARNLWWTWNQDAQDLFQDLSKRGWRNLYHNAVAVLHEVSDQELRARLLDVEFANRVQNVIRQYESYLTEKDTWAAKHAPRFAERPIAYFSAEFGFHETLPIAAGGLGILAGDHAKAASDLGLGFVGISLFYREGYFQQAINQDNWQSEYFTTLNPKNLPLETRSRCEGRTVDLPGSDRHRIGVVSCMARERRAMPGLPPGLESRRERTPPPRPHAAGVRR